VSLMWECLHDLAQEVSRSMTNTAQTRSENLSDGVK